MTRICFPLVRYRLKMPNPLADLPKLKYLAWAENRGESGNKRTANGSSKDSSISCGVKDRLKSIGELFQSNSIVWSIVRQSPMQCNYIVFTLAVHSCQQIFSHLNKQNGHRRSFDGHLDPVAGGDLLATFFTAATRIAELVN